LCSFPSRDQFIELVSYALIVVEQRRALSGTKSLRAQRVANRSAGDSAAYKLTKEVSECEFDVYIENTFANESPSLEFGSFELQSPNYAFMQPAIFNVGRDGLFGFWFSTTTSGQTVMGQTPYFSTAPATGRWIHARMSYEMMGSFVVSTSVAAGSSATALDSKTMVLDSGYAYTTKTFAVGLYEALAPSSIDLYFDNVRCR
jgi:NADPH-dependent curcumin reductase CurA